MYHSINPLISIIIPIYNSGKYLRKCFDSILEQTYQHYEVILINDGSKDDSAEICDEYSMKYSHFSFVNQTNAGVDKARNVGLELVKGEYITFIDSDDWIEKDLLKSYINKIQIYPYDLLIPGLIIDYGNSMRKEILSDEENRNEKIVETFLKLEKRYMSGFINKLYKTSIIKDNNLTFEYTLKEDLLFNIRYCKFIKSIRIIEEAYYHYVQRNEESLIKKRYPPHYMEKLITSLKSAGTELAVTCQNQEYDSFVQQRYLSDYIVFIAGLYNKPYNIYTREQRLTYIRNLQFERKKRTDIIPQYESTSKILFSKILKLPPECCDSIFSMIFGCLNFIK